MFKTDTTPTRNRVVLEEIYENAGKPGFTFTIPQPFTSQHVAGVTEVGASPDGVAQQLNQVLAENLSNNMAARVRAAVKNGEQLPTQADMDALYDTYDFTGVRTRTGVSGSLFDKVFSRIASSFIRKLIKKKGYQSMSAPVGVAKRGEEPTGNQISFDVFEFEVNRLISGDGPWGEVEAFVNLRSELIDDAVNEETEIRRREAEAEAKLSTLGL